MDTSRSALTAASLAVMALATPTVSNAAIAYEIPAGAIGNQGFGSGLGHDFDVGATPITITSLGVFDDSSDGIGQGITLSVSLWERDPGNAALSLGQVGPTLEFTNAAPGTLVGGSRFLSLNTPIDLPAGFQGSIVAYGFADGGTDRNGNDGGIGNFPYTTNDGGGLINFVGASRFGLGGVGVYPDTPDGGPVNRYGAGTFEYSAVPEPASSTFLLGSAALILLRRRRSD